MNTKLYTKEELRTYCREAVKSIRWSDYGEDLDKITNFVIAETERVFCASLLGSKITTTDQIADILGIYNKMINGEK